MSALTPRTPIVPSNPAIQPGAAIVNCHGSLCVIDGGAVSFGCSSTVPALRGPSSANAAPANNSNLIIMYGLSVADVLIVIGLCSLIERDFAALPTMRL
jgi:hypothetical protein